MILVLTNIHVNHAINLNVSVEKTVLMYENHPSILKINELGYLHNNFSFHHISEASIDNVIKNMDSNKAYQRDLSNRYQRIKINNTFSTWLEILYGVPQGSILGPLLLNIYICDIFLCSEGFDMANYADDCSLYYFSGSSDEVTKLQNDSRIIIDWYVSNYLKPNSDKWHLLLSYAGNNVMVSIDDKEVSNSSYEKILGVYFDNKLNFKTHINKLCKKASQKLHALARMSNFMSCQQKKNIMNAFILSQFSYCPLIWMCHSRSLNSQINKIHESPQNCT